MRPEEAGRDSDGAVVCGLHALPIEERAVLCGREYLRCAGCLELFWRWRRELLWTPAPMPH